MAFIRRCHVYSLRREEKSCETCWFAICSIHDPQGATLPNRGIVDSNNSKCGAARLIELTINRSQKFADAFIQLNSRKIQRATLPDLQIVALALDGNVGVLQRCINQTPVKHHVTHFPPFFISNFVMITIDSIRDIITGRWKHSRN